MENLPMRLYLSCKKDGIECRYGKLGSFDECKTKICKTGKEIREFIENNPYDICLCSSSMDFPEDETDDKAIIDLCNKIRR